MTTEHTRKDLRAERELEITHDDIARHVLRAEPMRAEAMAQLLSATLHGAARLGCAVATSLVGRRRRRREHPAARQEPCPTVARPGQPVSGVAR